MSTQKQSNVVEKSLGSQNIQFTYEQKKSFFAFLKNMQIDIVTIFILAISFTFIIILFFFSEKVGKEYTNTIQTYKDLKKEHQSISEWLNAIKDIKTIEVNGDRFLKMFELMNTLGVDYKISYDSSKNIYYSDLSNVDIEVLKQIIDKWIDDKILDKNSKKELTITEPWKGSIKLIFIQK